MEWKASLTPGYVQEAEPVMPAGAALPVVVWHHPPTNLPKLPIGDLSRPSASSSASLARMIGGLALAGTTADIPDQPPSPKPVRWGPHGSNLGSQLGSALVPAFGAQELQSEGSFVGNSGESSDNGYGGNPAGTSSRNNDSGAEDPANTCVVWADYPLRQGDGASVTGQPGSAPALHRPAALGLTPAAPGPASEAAREDTGISSSTAASAAVDSRMLPSSSPDVAVTDSNDTAGLRSSDAPAGDIAGQDTMGGAASGTGPQSDPAGPSSIAAYRPAGSTAEPGVGVGAGSGAGVDGDENRQGDDAPARPNSDDSLQKQGSAVGDSQRSGDGGLEGRRQTDPSGQPTQGPAPEFVQPFQEPLPPREDPAFHPFPVFDYMPFHPAKFAPPCAPRPIGFLAGYAPLLLLDMSGTMHPSKGGRFFDMKRCVLELLSPTGEVATVASGFDIIAFSSAPLSWAACYEGRLTLLEGATKPLLGRQNGRRAYRPNSASTGCMRLQKTQAGKLVPPEPALLAEAAHWVDSWQEPTGHTNYDAALQMAERYMEADCEYIFSDGLSDYAVVLLEKVRNQIAQGARVPVIHTVGFFAEEQRGGPGERFLRHLSALTGGTFQEYRPEVWRVWDKGQWLEYDSAGESETVCAERLWSEAALQIERRNNARLGLEESFADLMARLPQLHAQRVAAEAAAFEEQAATLRAVHEAECSMVRKLNDDIQRRSDAEYLLATGPVRSRNERHMAAAQHQHALALQQWQKDYDFAMMAWKYRQEPVDDIKLRARTQRKLAQSSALQPEDSAEQLSSMSLPSRPSAVMLPAYVGKQPALPNDSTPASGTASMQHTESVRQKLGTGLALDLETHTVFAQASAAANQPIGVHTVQDTSFSDGGDNQEVTASSPSADAAVPAADDVSHAAGVQQQDDDSNSSEPVKQASIGRSSMEVSGQLEDSRLDAQDAELHLQHADLDQPHDQEQSGAMQPAQQQGLLPQQSEQGALEHQTMSAVNEEPQASTSQSSKPKQGKSVYAARELTVLEKYEADVVHAYATSFVAEAMMQGMLPAVANSVAASQHEKLLAEVRRRNELNKVRHLQEVQAERAAWEAHEEGVKRWKASKAELDAGYAKELAEAKSSHQLRVLQAEYNRRVGIERAQHDLFCQPIRQRNAERHEAAAGRREQRRQVEEANDELVLAAEQLHQQRLYEAQAALSGQLVLARQQHADVCLQLQKDHAALQQAALQEHALQKAVLGRWNDQATLEARGRYSAEIARLQKAHALHCEAIQAQHDAVCCQIRQHNEAIWPQVTIAQAAQEELDRVGRFIEHIRWACLPGLTHPC
ncbi:hypothetical protein ABBQ32_009352 [Trebouxia sp. C0010 RCD-2024]